jgi:hypothetical protein
MSIHDNTNTHDNTAWGDIPQKWDVELPEWEIEPTVWNLDIPEWGDLTPNWGNDLPV